MNIRRAIEADRGILLDVWLQSVLATHTFVSQDDVMSMMPQVREYLASSDSEFWVICDGVAGIMGFIGMYVNKIESLFLAPEYFRRGAGRQLIQHAQRLHGELTVDVNEQNAAAVAFYKACGCVVEGRSEQDDQGRPYPLLHMRLAATKTDATRTAVRDSR